MAAPTGATSGANILTDGMSGMQQRKQTIQHNFSLSGLDASDELTTGYKGSPELMRDPSVQMDLHNLYIGSKENLLNPKLTDDLHGHRTSQQSDKNKSLF